jgi:hypothetical protein
VIIVAHITHYFILTPMYGLIYNLAFLKGCLIYLELVVGIEELRPIKGQGHRFGGLF